MIVVEQFCQSPFKWAQDISEGPCPKIHQPFSMLFEDLIIKFAKFCDHGEIVSKITIIDLQNETVHRATIFASDCQILYDIVNFAVSGDETHPEMESFEAFFEGYSLPNFIER
jgi:hypothetical protein